MASDDLVTFLLARIAEDEDAIGDPWSDHLSGHVANCATHDGPPGPFPCSCDGPKRLRAECEAKRRIVELHTPVLTEDGEMCGRCSSWSTEGLNDDWHAFPCETLQWLAWPYGLHPDWRDEWNPNPVMAS